jgi:cell division septation protein DedD
MMAADMWGHLYRPLSAFLALALVVGGVALLVSKARAAAAAHLPIAGSMVYANGTDLPWIAYGNDVGSNAWGSYGFHDDALALQADFSTMHAEGVTTARVWLFADARAGIVFDSSGTPTGLDSVDFSDLDALTSAAQANGVYLNLVLFDSSFMENATNLGSGVVGGGHAGLINTGSGGQALESTVVMPVLQHLANKPAVFSIETMNEPEACISSEGAGSNCSNPISVSTFNAWTTMVASDVHATDPGVLVTVGSASSNWVGQYEGDGLDYYQLHSYGTGYAPDVENTPASSFGLNKPIVVGEYGANQNSATFKQQMDGYYASGYAGAWVWSYGKVDSVGTFNAATMTAWNLAHPDTQVGSTSTTPTSTPTATPTATPTPTPTATPTSTPTPAPTATPSAGPTSESITNVPCWVGGKRGRCTGTFTPNS